MQPTINSVKHYVHIPVINIASGAVQSIQLVKTVTAPATAASSEVREGAVVKAIYVELWASADAVDLTLNALIMKDVAGAALPSFTEMNNLGSYSQKKNVFEFHQGLGPSGGNIIPLFRGWIKIPRGKQRFGGDDFIFIMVSSTGTTIHVCGFATYKEYV